MVVVLIKLFKTLVALLPPAIEREIYWHKNKFVRVKHIRDWKIQGKPLPPPHQYKQAVIEQVSKRTKTPIFVETGTLFGNMIEAQRKTFKKLYSVEIEPTLFQNAKKYFSNYPHIKIIQGDSSYKLDEILDEITGEDVLFWLDGHYSGGITGMGEMYCPIIKELEVIFNHKLKSKYILIDDARCFDGTHSYPTLTELTKFVLEKDDKLNVKVIDDLIHISY